MAVSKTRKQRAPRPRLPLAEKRRIVELALHEGASVRTIAHQHGICRNSLRRWLALYRAGKLAAPPAPRARSGRSHAALVPVAITPALLPSSAGSGWRATTVAEVTFGLGAVLRIETDALGADLIGALIAALR